MGRGQAMANVLSLIGLSGARLGQATQFSERSTVIGSAPDCDVVMKDARILPRHAELRLTLGRWFILPLDPQAMVLINGAPVQGQQRVNPGDLVTLGSATFKAAAGEQQRAVGSAPKRDPQEPHGTEDMWRD